MIGVCIYALGAVFLCCSVVLAVSRFSRLHTSSCLSAADSSYIATLSVLQVGRDDVDQGICGWALTVGRANGGLTPPKRVPDQFKKIKSRVNDDSAQRNSLHLVYINGETSNEMISQGTT